MQCPLAVRDVTRGHDRRSTFFPSSPQVAWRCLADNVADAVLNKSAAKICFIADADNGSASAKNDALVACLIFDRSRRR